jgi:hypothetical protein
LQAVVEAEASEEEEEEGDFPPFAPVAVEKAAALTDCCVAKFRQRGAAFPGRVPWHLSAWRQGPRGSSWKHCSTSSENTSRAEKSAFLQHGQHLNQLHDTDGIIHFFLSLF